jgi:DNA-nicking Smr family endonuclease
VSGDRSRRSSGRERPEPAKPGEQPDQPAGPSEEFSKAVGDVAPLADRNKRITRRARPGSRLRREGRPDPFLHPDASEPRLAHRRSVRPRSIERLRRGAIEPDQRIDLHLLRADAARHALARAIESAARAGASALLVIHGRGRHSGGVGVLREAVPEWLEANPRVTAHAPAPASLGGAGATVVLLRSR